MENEQIKEFLAPQLEVVENIEKGGFGVRAKTPIQKDALLALWSGVIYSKLNLPNCLTARSLARLKWKMGCILYPW